MGRRRREKSRRGCWMEGWSGSTGGYELYMDQSVVRAARAHCSSKLLTQPPPTHTHTRRVNQNKPPTKNKRTAFNILNPETAPLPSPAPPSQTSNGSGWMDGGEAIYFTHLMKAERSAALPRLRATKRHRQHPPFLTFKRCSYLFSKFTY